MTAVFLLVFVVQLFIYGFHELTEANVLPYSEPLHWATEPYGPEGRYGQYLSYMLVVLPVAWLLFVSLFGSKKAASPRQSGTAAVQQATGSFGRLLLADAITANGGSRRSSRSRLALGMSRETADHCELIWSQRSSVRRDQRHEHADGRRR